MIDSSESGRPRGPGAENVVLVVGSLHQDIIVEADGLPRRDETVPGRRWFLKSGGKGGNQAVAVARAGGAARMVGAVGCDDFGARLLAGLDAGGVDRRFVAEVAGVGSGMSVAVLDPTGDYAAAIVSGANLALDPAALSEPEIWRGVRLLVLQNEIPDAVNAAAAAAARERGATILLNAAPARDTPPALRALIDVLIVNSVEAEMLGGGGVVDLATAAAAAEALAAQFRSVVVTAGGAGLAFRSGQGVAGTVPAEAVRVVSTHGAGDAFIGAFAAGLSSGATLAAACGAASRAAAAHVAAVAP